MPNHRSLSHAALLSLAFTSFLVAQTTLVNLTGSVEPNDTPYNTTGSDHVFTIASGSATQSGDISGTGAVSKTGAGTITFSGTNTYTGGTTVSGGTLYVASDAYLGAASGSLAVTSGATLSTGPYFFTNRDVTFDGSGTFFTNGNGELAIGRAGTGSLALTNNAYADTYGLTLALDGGTGTVDISSGATLNVNAVTYINSASSSLNINTGGTLATAGMINTGGGTFNLAGGTLRANAGFTSTSNITLSNSSTVNSNGFSPTLSGILSGNGALTKSGSGTLTLSGANTYSGATTVSGGTLSIAADSGLGTAPGSPTAGHLTLDGGTLATTATFTLDANRGIALGSSGGTVDTASATALSYGGIIAGSGALTKSGAGTLTLTGANTYSGTTTISGGTVQLGDGTAPNNGSIASASVVNDGTLTFNRTDDYTFNNVISGTGGVINDGYILRFANPQTYTGPTSVKNGGYLVLSTTADQGLSASTTVDVETGATLDLSNRAQSIAGLTGAGTVYSYGGSAGSLDLDVAEGQSLEFSGALGLGAADFSLSKSGDGTQTLSGANTYTGTTSVDAGTLVLGSSTTSPSFAIASGATLELNVASGTRDGGNTTFTGSGTLAKTGAGTAVWGLGAATFELGSGAVIDVQGGVLSGGSSANEVWTNNLADLNVASGATLSGVEANVRVDALTGAGTITTGFNGAGYTALTSGVDDGSGTFSGVIANTDGTHIGNYTKVGSGTQILTGQNTYTGTTTISGGSLQIGNGADTGSIASPAVTNNANLTFNRSDAVTYGGAISGTGSVTQAGSGNLTLSGNNTYSGSTAVDAGTLSLASSSALGTTDGNTTIASGATLTLTNDISVPEAIANAGTLESDSGNNTLSGVLSGSGNLAVSGGSLTLTAANTFTGTTSLNGGNLVIGHSHALQFSTLNWSSSNVDWGSLTAVSLGGLTGYDSMALENDSAQPVTLTVGGNGTDTTFSGYFTNTAGSLVKTGSGTLYLDNYNYHTGSTTIEQGTLRISHDSALGAAVGNELIFDGGTLQTSNNSLTLDPARALTLAAGGGTFDGDITYNGVITGTGGLTKSGVGTLTLGGANTFSGQTDVTAGALTITNGLALQNSTLVLDGTGYVVMDVSSPLTLGGLSGSGIITSSNTDPEEGETSPGLYGLSEGLIVGGNNADTTYSGVLSGANQSLTKVGTGTLTLSGENTYSGGTHINGGTLQISEDFNLGDTTGSLNLDGGTLATTSSVGIDGSRGDITLGSGGGTFAPTSGTTLEIYNTLTGSGGLTKTDTGTLYLAGTNDYSGVTSILAGTLQLDSDAPGAVTIDGGTLQSNTNIQLDDSVTIGASGGTLAGSFTVNGALAGSGTLTKTGSDTLTLAQASPGFTGAVAVNAGELAFQASNVLDSAASVDLASGSTLNLDGYSATIADLDGAGGINFGGFGSLSTGDSNDHTLSGVLSSDGTLTKTGSGNLTLSGNNSYSGTTAVSAGTLTVGSNSALGSSSATVTSGATLDLNDHSVTVTGLQGAGSVDLGSGTLTVANSLEDNTFSGTLAGTDGALTKSDSGTLTLTGANSYTGATTISEGTLQIGDGGSTGSIASATVTNNATLAFNRSNGIAFAGNIEGSGAVNQAGSGTLTLSGNNTYTGATTVSSGTLALASATALGTTAAGTTVESTATLAFTNNIAVGSEAIANDGTVDNLSGTNSYAGALSGSGNLTVTAGQLTLSGNNTYTGTTAVNAGTLTLASANALGSTAVGTTVDSGATLAFTNDIAVGAEAITNSGTVDNVSGTNSYAGALSGSGNLTVTTGQLTLSGNNSSFSGSTAVNGGTLTLGSANALGSTSVDVANGAALDLNDHSVTIADLDTTGTGAIDLGSATLTTGDANDHAITGIISGTGSLAKQGSGTLTLSGANTYEGGTTVTTGTLTGTTSSLQGNIANEAAVVFDQSTTGTYAGVLSGTGSLTKSGNGNVTLSGNNSFSGATAVTNGTLTLASDTALGTIAAGTTVNSGATLAFTNNITIGAEVITNNGTVDNVSGTNSYAGALSGSGNLAVTAGQLTLSGDNSGFTGTTTLNGGTLSVSADHQLGSSSSTLTLNGGTLATTADLTLDSGRSVTLGSNGGTIDTATSTTLSTSGNMSGSGALTKSGDGTLALGSSNSYTGGTTVAAGTLDLQTSDALAGSAPVTVASGASLVLNSNNQTFGSLAGAGDIALGSATFTVGDSNDTTVSGVISGTSGSLVKNGSGTLTLSGVNTYTGRTTINDGTIAIAGDSGLGAAPISSNSSQLTLNGGTLLATTTVALDANRGIYLDSSGGTLESTYPTTLTVNGEITGGGNLGIDGEGNVTLARDNAFSGTTTLLDGDATLTLGHVDALKNSTLTTTSGLRFDSSLTSANIGAISGSEAWHSLLLENTADEAVALSVGNNGAATTYEGVISGTGSLTVTGGQLTLAGANTFTGTTTVTNGSLTLANVDALQNSTLNTNGSSTLSFGSLNQANLRGLTGNGSLTLSDSNFTLVVGGDGAYDSTYAGFLTGDAALEKTGTGNFTLSGSNSHRGDTTVSGGTLTIANSNALSDSTLTTVSGGGSVAFSGMTNVTLGGLAGDGDLALPGAVTLQVGQSGKTTTFSGELSGAGNLSVTGGSLTLDHANTLTGTVTPSSGTLVIGHADALQNATLKPDSGPLSFDALTQANVRGLTGSGSLDLYNSNFTLSVGGDGDYDSEFSGTLSGPGSLEKTGTGELILNGSNSMFIGSTTLTGGTVTLGSANALASSTLVTSDGGGTLNFGSQTSAYLGALDGDGTITLNNASTTAVALTVGSSENSSSSTFSGVLAGTGSLTKAGSGTLTLANANTFSGSTTINEGGLTLAHEDALQNSTLNTGSSGMLSFGSLENANVGGIAGSGSITLSSTHVNPFSLTLTGSTDTTYSGELSGGGSLVRSGTGNLSLTGSSYGYNGTVAVTGGSLTLNSGSALEFATVNTSSAGGSLLFSSTSATIGNLTGDGNVALTSAGSPVALTVGNASTNATYSGALSGSGSLTKSGFGTFTLAGANTFTGDTTISDGTLALGASGSLSGDVNLNSGGTLSLGNATGLQNSTVNLDGGNLAYNGVNAVTFGGLAGSGSLSLPGTSLTIGGNNADTTFSGYLSGSGVLIKTGTGNFAFNAGYPDTNNFRLDAGTFTISDSSILQDSTVNLNGGTLSFGTLTDANVGRLTGSGDLVPANATATPAAVALSVGNASGDSTYAGVMSGAGSLTKVGNYTFTLSNANTFTGDTTVNNGTLALGTTGSLAGDVDLVSGTLDLGNATGLAASTVNLNGGSLTYNGVSEITFGGIAGFGSLALPTTSLTVGANNADTAYSGSMSGSAAFIKTGTGTLTLQGISSYEGSTTVSAGTLMFNDKGAFYDSETEVLLESSAASRLTVAAGATATFSVDTTVASANGFLQPDDEDFELTESSQFTEADLIALLQHASFAEGAILGVDTTDAIGGEVTFQQLDYIGDLGLTKSGAGDLVLDTELGISGPTTITGGQLVLANSYALANSTVTTTAGLAFNTDEVTLGGISGSESLSLTEINDFAVDLNVGANDTDTTFSGEISGGGELRKIGDGTLTLSGANTYTGDTTVANGTLLLASDNALGATSSVQIDTDGTLDLNDHSVTIAALDGDGNIDLGSATLTTGDANNHELSGTIAGSGALTKQGTGELTLSGNNTYEGTTTVSVGTLTLRSDTALGTTAGGTTVASGATLAFSNNITVGAEAIANAGTVTNTSATNSYAGVLSGTGNLTVTDGSLTLSGANTYSGATAVNGGTLILGSANALGATSSVDIASGATLDLNNHSVTLADLDGAGAVALGSATLTTGDTNAHALSGVISGTGGLIKTGSGSLTLAGDNTFSGPTTVNGGSLSIAADSALGTTPGSPTAGQLTLNGGTLATTDSFALGANRGIELGSSGGTIETADATTLTYAGIIDGSGSFTKTGAGNLTLTGQSTYTGNTTIAGGTLTLDHASDALVTTTDVTITNGATLNLGTSSDHVDEVFLVDGTITAPSSGAFLVANAFNVQSGSITTTIDDVSGTGTLTKTTSGTVTLTQAAQYNGATDIQAGTFIVTGTEAQINNTSALTIGGADNATVTVSDGASIYTNALTLGDTSTGTGTLNITAPAGVFAVTSTGDAIIGNEGAGHVAISGGGSLGLGAPLKLAAGSNGTATVTVAGNDGNSQPSFIAALGSLIVAEGANSTATLTVSDGARAFVDGGMVIGAGSNSSGTVTITGANSVLTSASFGEPTVLTVALGTGTGSTGNLNLLDGATAILADTESINGLTAGPGSANVTINNATLATVAGGTLTSDVALTTAGTATLGTDTGTMSLSGAISGSGAVTKTGTGSLALSGNNTYEGATTVAEGTLTLASDAALGSTAAGTTVASGATLAFTNSIAVGAEAIDSSGTVTNSSGANTYAGALSGTGNLAVTGGSLTLSGGSYAVDGESLVITGDNTYTGATTIASGASLAFAGPFDPTSTDDPYNVLFGLFENGAPERFLTTSGIVNQGTLALNGVGYLANGSAITGGGDLTVSGVSAAVLQANGNQLGDVTVGSAATMVMAGDTTFTSLEVNNGLFSAEGGTSSINGSVDLGNDGTTGRGILEVWGAGTSLDITGNIANHGTAQVRVNGGQLSVTGNVNFAGTTNQADFEVSNGGSATIGGNLVLNGTLTSQGENVSPLGYMVASVRENSSLRVDGSIQLGLDAGTSGILNIEGALQIGGTNGIITGAGETEVNLGNGTLQVIGSDLTTAADMNLTWNPSAGTGTIDTNGFNAALSGALSGNGSLTKAGTGTLTLGGTNTYAGSTIVSGGTLALGADGTIANSAGVALGDGGILDLTAKSAGFTFGVDQTLSGSGTVNLAEGQTLTLAGMLAPGNSPGIITIDGNLVLNSSAVIAMELAPYGDRGGDSVDFDIIDVFGDLTLGGTLTLSGYGGYIPQVGDSFQLFYADSIGGSFAAINFTGFNGVVTFDAASLTSGLISIASVSAVPEPGTYAAFAGLAILGYAVRRRRR